MATKWILDGTHSEVQFKVKHLMITTVTGSFAVLNATVETSNEDFTDASVSFTADAASVTTGNEQRDGHIKSADFFNVEQFPEISFVSSSFSKKGDDYQLTGNLTIKGITKPVTLNVEFNGINKDPWGNEKAGFSLSGKINRKDWELNWNVALETGGLLVSDEVKLLAEVQFVKQA
ncbi:MAG: YceI family protein [Bacteroidetes bacterium]|nr:YceI family protein [Bacteroidota bacterium]